MVLGIDLGTCNTVAATMSRDGSPIIIPDASNRDILSTPTKVLLDKNRAFAGLVADQIFELYPDRKLHAFFKRYFGTGIPIYEDGNKNQWFSEGLAAIILKKVIYDTESFQPDGFEKCVITVPAHYNDIQRKSVYEAARLANLELSAIIDEPVAAALNYGLSHPSRDQELTLVYDFGGGTFDLTLITHSGNQLHVIAKDGIEKLGGKEFDEIIANKIRSDYMNLFQKSFPTDPLNVNKLQSMSEQLKINLNVSSNSYISNWMMFDNNIFESRIHVNNYLNTAMPLIEQTKKVVERCLRSMGLQLKDINNMLLIGGTSNSKFVYDFWQEQLKESSTNVVYHQPLNSVAKGAAIYAHSLTENHHKSFRQIELKNVSTYNIGINETGSGSMDLLIQRNYPLPVMAQRSFFIKTSQAKIFSLEISQFWDENEKQVLGSIELDENVSSMDDFLMDLQIEYKLNGTIGLKLRNAGNGHEIKFSFKKRLSEFNYDYQLQKKLVDNIIINNIF